MKNRFSNVSLQRKITLICLMSNLMVMIVNIVLMIGISNMSERIDSAYRSNIQLNELALALDGVQEGMTNYLNTKTSDALEDYYRSVQDYSELYQQLNTSVTGNRFQRMERNIYYLSENYVDDVEQTIEAKRGRNVEKYRIRYENATDLYKYIRTYVYSLNNEQLRDNSRNYNVTLAAFRNFELTSTFVMGLVIISTILIVTRMTGALIKPLKDLTLQADEVAKGNFDLELSTYESKDEIGVVTSAFNQMVVNIRQYIETIRQNAETERALRERELMIETNLKDAQLQYLQAQINPHFLFNTLNAGAQLAMMESADRTYEYVQKMAEFFRYNVKKGTKTVTIGEELDLIDNYIYILNVRFSGDIKYEKEVDATLLSVEMPSMILQPIVENCVNHGIREMMGEGIIWMKVFRDNDFACISVKDNGVGMSEDTIEKIMRGARKTENSESDFNGIGMGNVVTRLRLFSEYDDVVTIYSAGPNQGTECVIRLPIIGLESEE